MTRELVFILGLVGLGAQVLGRANFGQGALGVLTK
jgi:hypothetical protein